MIEVEKTALLEARKQLLCFRGRYDRKPTQIRMHPRVWDEICETEGIQALLSWDDLGNPLFCNLQVRRDPRMPGIDIEVK